MDSVKTFLREYYGYLVVVVMVIVLVVYGLSIIPVSPHPQVIGMYGDGFTYTASGYRTSLWSSHYMSLLHTDELYESIGGETLQNISLMCKALELNGWQYMTLDDPRLGLVGHPEASSVTLLSLVPVDPTEVAKMAASLRKHLDEIQPSRSRSHQ